PEDLLIHDEERRQLYAALSRLRGDYKTAIHLIFFEELSYKEAAYVMKKSEKQVQNLVYRAKEALRKDYRKEGLLQ
ncbi:MAG: sigma-70 family RNA polymerase sigma factor, partial [Clostridia bacterium]|nr:sigma-70 family RNA polymerase sigma factor [Clostridia bacterium]